MPGVYFMFLPVKRGWVVGCKDRRIVTRLGRTLKRSIGRPASPRAASRPHGQRDVMRVARRCRFGAEGIVDGDRADSEAGSEGGTTTHR